ncbi:FAD-dependent oxidoreductase [Novosphingobium resinovorum]|uniref:FAD-dependent oxidoreductase n=1 Tax=Novosphingobium resinovorum TaxID=158500 RepID=UPI002ED4D239
MTNIIIGAGVIGLTTALELLERGQDVTLVDQEPQEGLGASFANGGLLTPAMSDPWNAPGIHRHLAEFLFSSSSAIKLRWSAIPSLFAWGGRFLLSSTPARFRAAIAANFELGMYSLGILDEWRARLPLSIDASDVGTLKFFRSSRAFDAVVGVTDLLREQGLDARMLSVEEMIRLEPCLEPIASQLVGAIHYPQDKSGDAYLLCRALADRIRRLGGTFHFGREVHAIELRGGKAIGIDLGEETLRADNIIVAAGTASPGLVKRLGVRLAIKPVKGYSITYEPEPGQRLPAIPVVDDAYHAAVTPLGGRLRSVGTAEFAGGDLHLDRERVDNLTAFMKAVYPQIATAETLATGKPWTGLRPVAADGRPYIGETQTPGLWINSGHGHLGWTLAAGSARLLADLITRTRPEIAPEPYCVMRRA